MKAEMELCIHLYLLNLLIIYNDNYLFMFFNPNAYLLKRINTCMNTWKLALTSD